MFPPRESTKKRKAEAFRFLRVRPAGRTDLEVQVLYSPGKGADWCMAAAVTA